MESKQTRREFFGSSAAAVSAGTAVGAVAVAAAPARGSAERRKAIPGPPGAPYSRAVGFGELIFVAGVVGRNAETGELASSEFGPQCRRALENLKASVEAAGSTVARVLKCTCFLTDAADFATMNDLFREYFPSSPPARSTVVVKELVVPGAKIEIDCVTVAG